MSKDIIDRKKLRKTIWVSWGYTSLALFNIFIIAAVTAFLSVRFGGPRLFIGVMTPIGALTVITFFFSETIVNLMLKAKAPDSSNPKHQLFALTLSRLSRKAKLWGTPRAYIVNYKDLPNAVAYGPGLPFMRAVAVTEELLDLLNEKELEAVVAHEVGHIRSKDIGVMTFVGILLQAMERSMQVFLRGGSIFGGGPFAYIIGYIILFFNRFVLGLMRFAISQEREYAADALAADAQGTPEHLIDALKKLKASRVDQHDLFEDDINKKKTENPLESLMVSHPGMSERIESLRQLRKGDAT